MTKKSLYKLAILLCVAGYVWLGWSWVECGAGGAASPCLIRNLYHIPCPSCGSTRAVMALLQGNFGEAFSWNPLGFILLVGLIVLPLWLLYDGLMRKDSLYRFYLWVDRVFQRKAVFLFFILVILFIWCLNLLGM